jgi:hypothetical protein
MSVMGLDLFMLLPSGSLDRLCRAAVGEDESRPSGLPGMPANRGNGLGIPGMPGMSIPGGKNGFCGKRLKGDPFGLDVGEGRPAKGCLSRPKGPPGKPGGRPGIALMALVTGTLGMGVVGFEPGGGGEDLGDDIGLLFEVVVVMTGALPTAAEIVVVAELAAETTKLRGLERGVLVLISSCGRGSFSIAAKLLVIS